MVCMLVRSCCVSDRVLCVVVVLFRRFKYVRSVCRCCVCALNCFIVCVLVQFVRAFVCGRVCVVVRVCMCARVFGCVFGRVWSCP